MKLNITSLRLTAFGVALSVFALVGLQAAEAQTGNQDNTLEALQAQVQQLQQQVSELRDRVGASRSPDVDERNQLERERAREEEGEDAERERDREDADEPESDSREGEESQTVQPEERLEGGDTGPSDQALEAVPDFVRQRLQRGERNQAVRQLQEFMAQSPEIYPEGITSGYYGELTSEAVKRLKQRIGVQSDGSSVGPETFKQVRKLLEEGAGQSGVIPPGLMQAPGVQRLLEEGPTESVENNRSQPGSATDTRMDRSSEEEEETEDRGDTATEPETERPREVPGPPKEIDRLPISEDQKQQLREIFKTFSEE